MNVKKLHDWNLSYAEARALQSRLAERVPFTRLRKRPKLVAGVDCAFSRDGKNVLACVVVMKMADFEIVETQSARRKLNMPYIPGLLSFREAPACIAAAKKLQCEPDVFLIDGQGIAHPRRLGIAAHLGLFFDKPTIGCAKSRLIGEFDEPAAEKGAYTPLTDKGQVVGAVVRTRANVKPLFISVGNKCTLEDAVRIVLDCAPKYRLPEPTRIAHQLVSRLKLQT